jgi:hypothetical protein
MRERCPEHGLALGPDGGCVLCRRRKGSAPAVRTGVLLAALGAVVMALAITRLVLVPAQNGVRLIGSSSTGLPVESTIPQVTALAQAVAPSSSANANANARTQPATDRLEHRVYSERDPLGVPAALAARGELDVGGTYDSANESYELFLPASVQIGEPHGILVWIDAGPSGGLPNPQWMHVLARHRLIWAGPNRVGNDREISVRIGLALDSVLAVSRLIALDHDRVYVGGVSGGAKSAFRALLFYPEVFRGALLAAGVEYFREVPARSKAGGSMWPQRIGRSSNLSLAKTRPVGITTGPNDFNYPHISDVVAAMHEDHFVYVQLFSFSDLGHAPPPADEFERALTWVDSHR